MFRTSFAKTAVLGLMFSAAAAIPFAAETYVLDPAHTTVTWNSSHLGFSSPAGMFTGISGTLVLDEQDPTKSRMDVTIDTSKMTTGQADFDDHIKNADFLDVTTYPTATFKSTEVRLTGETTALVTGDLTLRGITRPLILNVRLNKMGMSPINNKKVAGFSAGAMLRRSDYGMTYGLPGVGDMIRLDIEAEASPAE